MQAGRTILRDVNQCIYCHTTEGRLTQEHIVPFGLNGEHVLLHASCSKCAVITSKIELTVLKTTFIAARKYLNLKSRHTKVWNNPKDAFLTLLFPLTEMPAYLSGKEYKSGVNVTGIFIVPLPGLAARSSTVTFHGNDFERMLAKIGMGFAIGKYGIEAFEKFYVLPAILGELNDIGRWVGTAEDKIHLLKSSTYKINLTEVGNEVICRIKLFPMFDVPEYLVVVGNLKSRPNEAM